MLHLVKGRAGSGKSEYLRELICNNAENGEAVLIVPEQFSFETERTLLKIIGAKKIRNVKIVGFSRLALSVLRKTPHFNEKKIASDGVKRAIMNEALLQLNGELEIFTGKLTGNNILSMLVDFNKELKLCGVDYKEFLDGANLSEANSFLREKSKELALINETYDALLSQSFFDDSTAVSLFADFAAQNGYFKGKTVYIDGFRSFSGSEFECLKTILSQADVVYIALCADSKNAFAGSAFEFIKKFENQIRSLAAESAVTVDEVVIEQSDGFCKSGIRAVEQAVYSRHKNEAVACDGSVELYECGDIRDECEFVARRIRRLVRENGYRCRDIAVVERSNGTYKSGIINALKKADIPVFDDNRRPLTNENLFVFLKAAFLCVTSSFSTENIMCYLKSGLSGLSVTEIGELENYALIWGIGASAWLHEFKNNPDGFGEDFTEARVRKLEKINALRERAVAPLMKLKEDCVNKNGEQISKAVFSFLKDECVADRLYEIYTALNADGFPVEAERRRASWDALVSILDDCNLLCADRNITLKHWVEIFAILAESRDMGEIPQGLDEVTVGSADRIRTENKKVVFLVGVNKDEFPLVNVPNGILTDRDRTELTANGVNIRPPFESTVSEERFIAYCSVTVASEKLIVTYKTVDSESAKVYPSELTEYIKSAFSDLEEVRVGSLSTEEKIETYDEAFSTLASNYRFDSVERATLLELFSGDEFYTGKLGALEKANGDRNYRFADSEKALELFGKNISISATKVDTFYKCPFSYFMQFGLKAYPLQAAELNSRQGGTIIHYLLENILKNHSGKKLSEVSDDELRAEINSLLTAYMNEKMGGVDDKSPRFRFLFDRFCDTAMAILGRLKTEFSFGEFEPCGFELNIGKDIPEYCLPLKDGEVSLHGAIDRIDKYEKDGIKYIRIIDYKTGNKVFELSELFDGINVQMVLYLMALLKNGTGDYADCVPAGVLYLPSRLGLKNYLKKRTANEFEINQKRIEAGKLSGMVLASPVVFNAMGVSDNPKYFPVGLKAELDKNTDEVKDYTYTGNYYNQSQFGSLSKKIDEKIVEMGDRLHCGDIPAMPMGKSGNPLSCSYCSYKCICGYEEGDRVNELNGLSHIKALVRLDNGEGEISELD